MATTASDSWRLHSRQPMIQIVREIAYPHVNASVTGTSPATGQTLGIWDLELGEVEWHEREVAFYVHTTNGGGGTPTSPGAGKTITVKYGFGNWDDVAATATADAAPGNPALADIPTICQSMGNLQSLVITLPDTSSSSAAGKRLWTPASHLVCTGRYFFAWYDRDGFASANAVVTMKPRLYRI